MLERYLVKNGTILDVTDGSTKKADILVVDGIVQKVGQNIVDDGAELLDASGMTVTTGWVDDHAHIYSDTKENIGIDAERCLLPFGVTYAVDPGTAGADNYEDFRKRVGFHTDIRYRSFLNISRIGVPVIGADLGDMANMDEDACRQIFRKYRGEMVGLKARISAGICADPLAALQTIRRLADELDTHFCVHATKCTLSTETILGFFREGDMLTHCYGRNLSGILDEDGTVKKCVWEARERGVLFDVGHGVGSFSFETARKAISQGFLADCLSTDLHVWSVASPVYDMPTTLSKFLSMGVELLPALQMITTNPVRALRLTDKDLKIEPGKPADLTVFCVETGCFSYMDSEKEELTGAQRVVPQFTCLRDKVYFPTRVREQNRPFENSY